MTRQFTKQAAAIFATCGLAATCAMAQPTPDAIVAVNAAGTQLAPPIAVGAGQVRWIRIDLGVDLNASTANFLDIIGGNTDGTAFDSEFFLFDNAGTFLVTDDDDGPGAYSQLSMGGGCGSTARSTPTGEGVPTLAAGATRNGIDGARLAGTYWLAIAGFNSNQTTAPWGVATTSTLTGTVNATFDLGAAGTPPVAPSTNLVNLGSLTNPTTVADSQNFAGSTIRWYQFTIPAVGAAAGNSFLDIWTSQGATGGAKDTELTLYRADGTLVASDDEDGVTSFSALSFGLASPTRALTGGAAHNGRDGATLPAGTYYLATSYFSTTNGATCFGAVSTSATAAADVVTNIVLNNFSSLPPSGASAFGTTSVNNCGTATSLLTTTVTPGTNPVSTGITVTADLSAVNGSATQQMFDDGTNGDVTGGDNVFSFLVSVSDTVTAGAKVATMTVADAQARSTTNTATLTVTACPPPPAVNDDCANAIVIGPGSGSYPFSTAGASVSAGFTYCTGTGGDVFYSWTAGASGACTIDNCGTATGDTVIAIFDSCAGGTSIACSDDFCGAQSSVTFTAVEGTTYIVAVKNWSSSNPTITGTLNITAPTGVSVAASFSPTSATNCGDQTALLTAVFTPAVGSTGITATADLTDIDASLSATQQMFDDGTNGDVTGGDNTFSYLVTVPATALTGTATANVTAQDAQGRTAADGADLTIITCPPTAPACPEGTLAVSTTGLNSGGSLATPNSPNGSASATVSGSGLIANEIRISGLVAEVNAATWASELRLRVTTPSGATYDFQPSPVAGAAGTAAERGFDEPTTGAGFRSWTLLSQPITPEAADGVWTVLAYEAPEVPASAIFDDAGLDATWTNVCVTFAGTPGLPTCGSIDFNGDGLFPDDSDLIDFLNVLAGGECSTGTCETIDFNRDELFPDDNDLVDFLTVLAGGSPTNCTP